MADYSDLLAGNPYFQPAPRSNLSTIGSMLANLGAGIAGAGASGQPWMAGIAPGAAMASNAVAKQKEQDELEEARRFQMGLHLQQLKQLQDDRDLKNAGIAAWVKNNGGGVPDAAAPSAVPGGGMQAPQPPLMAPPVARPPQAGGGVNDNNIGNVRPPGANTGFQQPPDFDSGVGLTIANARSYPRTYNGGQPMTLAQIGAHWAPVGSADDPTGLNKNWVPNVAKLSGLNPDAPIDLSDPATATAFVRGVHGAEKGPQAMKAPEAYAPGIAKGLPGFQIPGMPTPAGVAGASPMPSGGLPPGASIGLPPELAAPPASPVLPPFQIPGMPTGPTPPAAPSSPLQPAIAQGGSDASPVPQPIQPAQFTPPPALPAPGPPPQVPRPTALPPAEANYLNNMVMTRQITPQQAEAEKSKRLDAIHHDQQSAATEAWKQQNENYRFNRGEANKQDRWEMIPPQEAQTMGLPPNVQFQRNKSGEIKPVRDTKEVDKDISPLYAAPEVQSIVDRLSPVDRAAFNAATKLGDHKGAATILTKGQTGLTEEQQKLTGQALLDTLPFGDKENVTGLVEGRLLPSQLSKRAGNGTDINRYLALAQRVDPSYTPNDAGARNAFETKYMVTGPGGQTLQAANTVMPHLETWLRLQTALGNGDSQTVNSILNAAKKQFGDAKVTSAEAASELYGTEVAKAIRGSGALNEKEELAAKAMTSATKLSPDQAKGVASTLTEMMMGRVHVLQDTAVHMHGVSQEKANNYMLPSSREALDRISKGDFSGGKGAPEPNKMRPSLNSIFGTK